MPVIHRENINVSGIGGKWISFCKITKYDSRAKSFSIGLPDFWDAIIGYKIVYGDTEAKVNSAYRKAEEAFKELSISRRKVIIYKFSSQVILSLLKNGSYIAGFHGFKNPEHDHCIFRTWGSGHANSIRSADGTAIDVYFEVANECSSRFQEHVSYIQDGRIIGDGRDKDLKVMEWTPEREQFFLDFELELSKLAYKLNTFLNGDQEELVILIDQYKNVLALPLPKEIKNIS